MAIRKPLFAVPLALGTIATGNEASGFPASNLGETDAAGLVWKSSGASNVWARGQMTASASINFAAIMSANALAGTKYRLRLGASQAAVDAGSVDITNSTNTTVTSKEYGWWNVQKTSGTTGSYNAAAVSADGFSGDFVLAIKPSQITGIGHLGMNSDPNTGTTNTGIDYGFVINATTATANNNGTNGSSTTISAASYLFLVRSGTTLTLRYGTSDDYTAATTLQTYSSVSSTLYFDCSISTLNNAYDVRLMSTTAIPTYDSGIQTFISPSISRTDGLYHSHLEFTAAATATWWRLDITGHTGDFQASSLVLGQSVQSSRFYNPDFEFGAEDLGEVEVGRFGVPDITPGVIMRTLGFTLEWQSEAEFEATFRPIMETRGRTKPLWVCLDPDATTYRQAKTYLGFLRKVPYATGQRKPGLFSQEFTILSLY